MACRLGVRCGVGRGGFTLVELLIVVVILGVLAGIVVPQFSGASVESRRVAFVSELRVYRDAAVMYINSTWSTLEDSSSGEVPSGFEEFIDVGSWVDGTPLGGVWDVEASSFGYRQSLGVHFMDGDEQPSDEEMVLVDGVADDGDLESGSFRQIAGGRFYEIIRF